MKFLRRNWAILLAASLIPFVVLLAVLQQDWIRQMGERERFRLRQGLFVAAGELVSAFQRELLLAPLAIAPPLESFGNGAAARRGAAADPYSAALASGDWSFFAERWRGWKNYALDPSIVKAVHLVQRRQEATPVVRSWNGRSFVREGDQALVARIVSVLEANEAPHSRDSGLIHVGGEEWDLVPLPDSHGLLLVVRYDLGELTSKVLPRLADIHLDPMTDYRFRIVDRETGAVLYRTDPKAGDAGFDQPDLRIGLFRRNFGALDGLGFDLRGTARQDAPLLVLPQAGDDEKSREAQIAAFFDRLLGESVWTIEAVHRNGSLAGVARASTIRNLLASSGILLLLAASIVALAFSNRRALALAARQEEFVASVTHELKTPLAVIGSAASNLADGIVRDRDATLRYGSTIGAETRRLVAMIDKLLFYTRLGSTRAAGRESVDIGALAASVIAERTPDFEALGFRVEKSLPREPLLVRGDESALRLVVANLVANVIIHAAGGAYLGIFVAEEGGKGRRRGEKTVVLRVDDRGPGIPRRERKTVFEAFYRGRLARERQEPGTGIGLNLVRRVVQAHGGGVTLESAEGFGTSVAMTLPLAGKGSDDGTA